MKNWIGSLIFGIGLIISSWGIKMVDDDTAMRLWWTIEDMVNKR
jgi:hypothetical protein